MTLQSISKIQIKINTPEGNVWVHFCYVPSEVREAFQFYVNTGSDWYETNLWIERWALAEFGIGSCGSFESLKMLKEAIYNKYKDIYPDLFVRTTVDSQGWLRVWYTNNMNEELKKHGR